MGDKQNLRSNGDGQKSEEAGRDQGEQLTNPGRLDFERASEALKKIVRENKEWLKEMANR